MAIRIVKQDEPAETEAKIAVGVPNTGYVHHTFMLDFRTMWLPHGTWVVESPRCVPRLAREKIAEDILNWGADYLLFLDSDMGNIPADLLLKLIKHDKDIVCATFFKRKSPFSPCVYRYDAFIKKFRPLEEFHKGLVEIDGCGMAATLIKTEIFKKLSQPWFGEVVLGNSRFGEDLSFCYRAREAGFRIFCDTDTLIKHIGDEVLIGEEEYLQELERRKNGTRDTD